MPHPQANSNIAPALREHIHALIDRVREAGRMLKATIDSTDFAHIGHKGLDTTATDLFDQLYDKLVDMDYDIDHADSCACSTCQALEREGDRIR